MRARTVRARETEETQTATLFDRHCGEAAKIWSVGWTLVTRQWNGFMDVCFSNDKMPPLIPPLLLLSSTKNVNVLALNWEQG